MQQREEKQSEAAVDSLISHVGQTKNASQSFIFKSENEYERSTWPNVSDNFGSSSGQSNTINKMSKNEKTPSFRSQVIIPSLSSQKPDSDSTTSTEQRVQVFSHEIVPDYSRTKPDPEVEEQEKQSSAEAARIGPDVAQKQIQASNKMCSNSSEKSNNPRDDRDAESAASRSNKPSFNPGDTNALVAAVAFGKGLSKCRPPGPMAPGHPGQGPMMSGGPTLQQVTIGGGGGQQAGMGGPVAPQQQGQPDKIPGLSREGSPQSATSNKEENNPPDTEKEEPVVAPVIDESKKSTENLEERRTMAIAAKAKEIEKVYRQDCETFGMVVKMLVAKDPSLEKQSQVPLRENLGEIRERCLEDLKHFIKESDEEVRSPEPPISDSANPASSQKLLKTGVNHSSSF